MTIHPLIICGGNGTRLWPISRTESPKQFQRIGDEESETFFQAALRRHSSALYARPLVISALRHRDTVAAQLAEIGAEATVLHEPMGRNTGPAVLAAALTLLTADEEAVMVVIPADHVIEGDLDASVQAALPAARAGRIVTFGVKPRYAETGFGYITDGGPLEGFPGVRQVERFVEKPPLRKARLLVESDIAFWASGLSMFRARTIVEEYERFDAATVAAVRLAVRKGTLHRDGLELNAAHFAEAAAGPTEQVVFERTRRIALAPLGVEWSDVGCWTAMYGISKSNPQGNVLQGDVVAVETTNSMVRSTSRLVTVVGMKDVIVIDTADAVLVTRVGHCQSVKKVAEFLKAGARVEAESHGRKEGPGVPTAFGAMVPVFMSDSLEIVSVRIAAGESMMLDAVDNREIVVSQGEVTVRTLTASAALRQGQRMDLQSALPNMLVNPTGADVEVLLLTMLGGKAAVAEAPAALAALPAPGLPAPSLPALPRTPAAEGPLPLYA